jgi:multidrug efflux pump subunit AcrA (membrane-fusion protein)
MMETVSGHQENPQGGGTRHGHSKMVLLWLVPFVVFAALGIYSLAARRNTSRVLAERTIQMAVPTVAVIHATPLNVDAGLVLPGSLEAYVDSPIYARTNGYLKKWYSDIGSP